MRALHPVGEPPCPCGRAARGVVTAQQQGGALLRRLHRREHESRSFERHVHGSHGDVRRIAQPEPAHRQEGVLPQGRDHVAPLQLGLRHRHQRQVDAAMPEALGERRRGRPARVPWTRRQIAARQLAHRPQQRAQQITARRPLILEESGSEQRKPARPARRRDEPVRRRGAYRRLERIRGGGHGDRRSRDGAERGPRHGGRSRKARRQARAQPVPPRPILDLQDAADQRAVGVEHHDQTDRGSGAQLEARLERRHQRPGGEAAHLDRPGGPHHAIACRWAVGIRVAGVAAVFDPQQLRKPLPAAAIVQRQGAARLERHLDPVIDERAALDLRAFAARSRARRGGAGRDRHGREPQAGQWRRPHGDPNLVHLVVVGVVPQGIEPLARDPPVEHLHRDRSAVRRREHQGPVPRAGPGNAVAPRPDQHIAPEHGHVGEHYAAARARRRIPENQRGLRVRGAGAGRVRIVTRQIVHAAAHDLRRQRLDAAEARFERACHGIARATRDAVVELAAHQPAPREVQQRPPVAPARPARQRCERLGQPRQRQLGRAVAPLERRPGRMHALERPRVPVRPAQLPRERRRLRPVGGRLEELVETRHPVRALGIELRQEIAQARNLGVRCVVIGPDEDGNVLAGGARHEGAAHRGPGREHALSLGRKGRADLVPCGWQVPQQHLFSVGTAPAVQVTLLPGLAPQAAPHDAVADPEFARQRGPRGGMAEGVGRIQHVESPAPPLRVRRAQEQVPHQPFARRNLLVGQHVPRPDLEATRLDQRLEVGLALGPHAHVVLEQHGLAVQQEAPVRRVALQPLDQVVQHGDEPRLERGARQIPLAVPVGVGDEVKDQAGHWR